MAFKFPKGKVTNEVFNYAQNSFLSNIIFYIIDSNYNNAVDLRRWYNNMDLSSLNEILHEIPNDESYDKQVVHCLRWVRQNITYKSDKIVWKANERWQTVSETINKKTGDCEDGAILLYALCRLKGVPANRLLIMAGDVEGGGHCWLAYKPEEYPLDFSFLDWCYWYNANNINNRPFYQVIGKEISDSTDIIPKSCKYKKLWFAFNEEISYRELNWKGGII